ncbi:MAG: hypothetical protein LPK43_01255 [Gammaproteobacteria bacterium]|nr:hypothetical protein [Gammaproteobacteria bacterium]
MIAEFFRSELHIGLKVLVTSLVLGMLSWMPLLLYILVGPADGNPIGLGLLAMAGTLLAVLGMGVGLLWWVFGLLMRPRA